MDHLTWARCACLAPVHSHDKALVARLRGPGRTLVHVTAKAWARACTAALTPTNQSASLA